MPDETTEISGFGLTAKNAPRWVLGLVAVTACAAYLWTSVLQPQRDIVTAREASAAAQRTIDEYSRHIGERPALEVTLRDDAGGVLTDSVYTSDWCIRQTWTPRIGRPRSRLLVDMATDPHGVAAWPWFAVVEAAAPASRCDSVPHGAVVDRQRKSDGVRTVVYVRFEDGCAYEQIYDGEHNILYEPRWLVCRH